jgi:hypothetical protein
MSRARRSGHFHPDSFDDERGSTDLRTPPAGQVRSFDEAVREHERRTPVGGVVPPTPPAGERRASKKLQRVRPEDLELLHSPPTGISRAPSSPPTRGWEPPGSEPRPVRPISRPTPIDAGLPLEPGLRIAQAARDVLDIHRARPRGFPWRAFVLLLLALQVVLVVRHIGPERLLRALGARSDAWMTIRWKAEQESYRCKAPLFIHYGQPRDARLDRLFADPRVSTRASRCIWLRLPLEQGGEDRLEVRHWSDASRIVSARATEGLDVPGLLLLLEEGLGDDEERAQNTLNPPPRRR